MATRKRKVKRGESTAPANELVFVDPDETGLPRVDGSIVDDIEASMKALSRRERRDLSRRTTGR